ncbi:DUF2637 domain-containing protein [Krasilnikovia sp. MM14-A1259]|uniref:DUF2637 domain-containing protein n=1 Tax=Krasilnikovia sp. MM14-A1259 TaxID=3373539 RepID=UPI003803EDAB
MTTTPKPASRPASSRVNALQDVTLLIIVLLVGVMAGAASFNHVHDFTIDHSPTGTADWFGWANAVISELIPTASLIEIARRRRRNPDASVGYPMVLLVGAVGFSLTAQLAVATPGVFGWMVSALPALAFFALSKLVFTTTRPTTDQVTATLPDVSRAPSPDITRPETPPAAATPTTRATATPESTSVEIPSTPTPANKTAPAPASTVPATAASVPAPAPAAAPAVEKFPAPLLASARTIAASHRHSHGDDINPNQLAVRLRVPTTDAADILTQLANHPTVPADTRPRNGSPVTA